MRKRRLNAKWLLLPLLPAVGVLLFFLLRPAAPSPEVVRLTLDGNVWAGGELSPDASDLRVVVTLDGNTVADLPFSEAHSLTVETEEGRNTVLLNGTSVRMESADCANQDCVNMGEVTRENLETRVLGGWIICLPHHLSVEIREP